MTMLAFVGTEISKPAVLKQLRAHAKADEIVKGHYWENGKGCAVGCTIYSANHVEYESRFGIPQMLARLEDRIFEGLPNDKAKKWPIEFISAVNPGSDLSCAGWQFLHWLLTDEDVNPGINHPLVRDAIKKCADVLVPLTKGEPVDRSAAWSAASAAWSAARGAASAARGAARGAESAAASAAWSAARSAASAAESAAASAESAAWSAESAAWSAESAAASAWSAAWSAESAESAESAAWSASSAAASAWSAASAARGAAWSAASAAASAWSAESAASAAYVKMSKKLLALIKDAPVANAESSNG